MIFDIILIIIICGFVLKGFRLGLIEGIGSIVGIIVGLIVATNYYLDIADKLPWLFLNNQQVAETLSFLLVFIIANRAIAFVFWIFDKVFKIIAFIPFLKSFNRLLGAALVFLEGVILIGIVLNVLINFSHTETWSNRVDSSKVAYLVRRAANIVNPLIPKSVEELKNYSPDLDLDKYKLPEYKTPDIEQLLK